MWENIRLAIARHVSAAILAFLSAMGILHLVPEGAAEAAGDLAGVAVMVLAYAIWEKLLKPIWQGWFGEQPV